MTKDERRAYNRDKTRRYRERHPERAKTSSRRSYERTQASTEAKAKRRASIRAAARKYRGKDRESYNAYMRDWNRRNPDKLRATNLKKNYGMTLEQYAVMLEAQGGACAICGTTDPGGKGNFHVDHDHGCCSTKKRSCGYCIRGLLCSRCNTGLGLLGDAPATLRSALRYLET